MKSLTKLDKRPATNAGKRASEKKFHPKATFILLGTYQGERVYERQNRKAEKVIKQARKRGLQSGAKSTSRILASTLKKLKGSGTYRFYEYGTKGDASTLKLIKL